MFSAELTSSTKKEPYWNDTLQFLDDEHDEALFSALYTIDDSSDGTESSLIPSLYNVFGEKQMLNHSNDILTTTTSDSGADKLSSIKTISSTTLKQSIHDVKHNNTSAHSEKHQKCYATSPHLKPPICKTEPDSITPTAQLTVSLPDVSLPLTQNEKKLRRRAQVARSAQKHRHRQKEELNRLRREVCRLQSELLAMGISDDSAPANGKRKSFVHSDALERVGLNALTEGVPRVLISNSHEAENWRIHLPANPNLRAAFVHNLLRRRTEMAMYHIEKEHTSQPYRPQFDLKINVNDPCIILKAVRCTAVEKFDYEFVSEAAWQSAFNFELPIPHWLKRSMIIEKLEEFDENTRYGRVVMPLFRRSGSNEVIFLHSYFLMRRVRIPNRAVFVWDSVYSDELYPFKSSSTNLLNLEAGCSTYFNHYTNGKLRTVVQRIVQSRPPVGLVLEPNCRLTECFFSFFVRRSDLSDNATRLQLIRILVAHEKSTEDTEKALVDIRPPDAFSREYQ